MKDAKFWIRLPHSQIWGGQLRAGSPGELLAPVTQVEAWLSIKRSSTLSPDLVKVGHTGMREAKGSREVWKAQTLSMHLLSNHIIPDKQLTKGSIEAAPSGGEEERCPVEGAKAKA